MRAHVWDSEFSDQRQKAQRQGQLGARTSLPDGRARTAEGTAGANTRFRNKRPTNKRPTNRRPANKHTRNRLSDRLARQCTWLSPRRAHPLTMQHIPVLLSEVVGALHPVEGQVLLDGTFGAGGYSTALLEAGARQIIGIDQDPTAIEAAKPLKERFGDKLTLVHSRFSQLDHAAKQSVTGELNGVVLDIGVSSMQIDQAERGFSFQADGPLDMRMACDGVSAADLVNTLDERQLAQILYVYGEEKRSRRIAKAIVERRPDRAFTTTGDLAHIIQSVLGRSPKDKIHPATRTFQALRIAVNRELDELANALFAAEHALAPGGRLVVVTFHSLEDRIVKRFFADRAGRTPSGSRHLPEQTKDQPSFELLSRKPQEATSDEIAQNPRSRSARLRAGIRLATPARGPNPRQLGLPDLGFDLFEGA